MSRISSRRPPRIFGPTHRPLGCLALGFLARCGAGFSLALHRAPHPARGPILPGHRSYPGTGGPLCVKMGSAHSSLPGPAYQRAQVAQPIHPVSECHFRVRLRRDAALGPRTLRSAPDSHTILTRSSLDSHRFALDSHPIRTRISLDPHSAHSRIVLDSRERNYKLFAHLSQVALCAQPIWLRMPLAGRGVTVARGRSKILSWPHQFRWYPRVCGPPTCGRGPRHHPG